MTTMKCVPAETVNEGQSIGSASSRFGLRYQLLLIAVVGLMFSGCDGMIIAGYSFNYTGVTAEKSETGEFASDTTQIDIQNQFGNIQIETATDGEPSWLWEAKCWGDTKEIAEAQLDETFLIKSNSDTESGKAQRLELLMPEQSKELNGLKSNFTLFVPEGVEVNLVNRHGDIDAKDLTNKLAAENSHGNVSLVGLTGTAKATNSHGNLTANGLSNSNIRVDHGSAKIAQVDGDLEFYGSHGNVSADLVSGDLKIEASHSSLKATNIAGDAKLKTSHNNIEVNEVEGDLIVKNGHGNISVQGSVGNVTATNSHAKTSISTSGERVKVASSHGSIKLNILNSDFESIEAKTGHNNISVKVPAGVSANIKMSTSHGSMNADMKSDTSSDQVISLKNEHGDIDLRTAK